MKDDCSPLKRDMPREPLPPRRYAEKRSPPDAKPAEAER